jgi:hypothetical protein
MLLKTCPFFIVLNPWSLMKYSTEYILLGVGFVLLIALSIIIERKVTKQLSQNIGRCTYIAVAIISIYYIFDVIYSAKSIFTDIYFYFWTALTAVEILLFRLKKT